MQYPKIKHDIAQANKSEQMPKGPQGQRRPADLIGNAVRIAQIATGEIEDSTLKHPAKRRSGLAGSKVRIEGTHREHKPRTTHRKCKDCGGDKGGDKMERVNFGPLFRSVFMVQVKF